MIQRKPAFYELFHMPTGMTYGGSSGDARSRIRTHKNLLARQEHANKRLQEIYTTWDDFEVRIYYTSDIEMSRSLEAEYLRKNLGLQHCCNGLGFGDTPVYDLLDKLTPIIHIGFERLPGGNRSGRPVGYVPSEETRRKIGDGNRGKVMSQEARERISLGRRSSEKVKAVWEDVKTRDHVRIRINGVEYNSIAAASRVLGIGHATIARRLASKNFVEYERL